MWNYNANKIQAYVGSINLATSVEEGEPSTNLVSGRLAGNPASVENCCIAGDVELGEHTFMTSCVVGEGVKLRVGSNCILQACAFMSGDITIGNCCGLGAVFVGQGMEKLVVGSRSGLSDVDIRMPGSTIIIGKTASVAYLQMVTENTHIHVGDNLCVYKYLILDASGMTDAEKAKKLNVVIGDNFTLCPLSLGPVIGKLNVGGYPYINGTDMSAWAHDTGASFRTRQMNTGAEHELELCNKPKSVNIGDDVTIGVGLMCQVQGAFVMGTGSRFSGVTKWCNSGLINKMVKLQANNVKLSNMAQVVPIAPSVMANAEAWRLENTRHLGSLTLGYGASCIVNNDALLLRITNMDQTIPDGSIFMQR